jgi:hypothetical protein
MSKQLKKEYIKAEKELNELLKTFKNLGNPVNKDIMFKTLFDLGLNKTKKSHTSMYFLSYFVLLLYKLPIKDQKRVTRWLKKML